LKLIEIIQIQIVKIRILTPMERHSIAMTSYSPKRFHILPQIKLKRKATYKLVPRNQSIQKTLSSFSGKNIDFVGKKSISNSAP